MTDFFFSFFLKKKTVFHFSLIKKRKKETFIVVETSCAMNALGVLVQQEAMV